MTNHDASPCLSQNASMIDNDVANSEACCDEQPSVPAHMNVRSYGSYAAAVAVNHDHDPHLQFSNTPFSHSSSMEFILIREVDADILEQGVEEKRGADLADFDDEGRRLEASESNVSLTELESEAIAREEELDLSSRSAERGSSDGLIIMGDSVDESRNDLSPSSSAASSIAAIAAPPLHHTSSRKYIISASSNNDNISMPAIAEDASCHIPHPSSSDNILQPQSHINDNIESVEPLESQSESNDYFLGATSPQSPPKPQIQIQDLEIDHEALARRIASGRAHHRSASFDRRMSESAQFAEAVGEELDSLLLKKIIEEDSSSDFDDDEIDEEGGANLILHEDEQAELLDYKDADGQHPPNQVDEQSAGEPSSEKIEPTCVSTDLAQMSLQSPQELPQLSTTSLETGAGSAPTTPAPSPCKANSMATHPRGPPVTTCFHPPCYVDWKFTFSRQHSSGSNLDGNNTARHKGSVPNSSSGESDFVYRGIRANPPEIIKAGMARGNYAQLHRKAWLEVSDKHHRYGKNLRMYYRHWEALEHPFYMFFDWLDSKGDAIGNPLPNLPEIPRPVLDSDTVLYITNPEIQASYALDIVANPADGSAIILDQNGTPIDTGKDGWIFVLRDHVLYGSQKVTAPHKSPTANGGLSGVTSPGAGAKPRQRFHHSSFFGGKAVASAGIFLTNEQGRLTQLYPHSGHYRPGEAHMQRSLFFFQQLGVELATFVVDMQQIFKVSRKFAPGDKGKKDKENNSTIDNGKHSQNGHGKQEKVKKSKKTDCLHLMCAAEVACFLAHKALMIERGVFHQIHKIRRIRPMEMRDSVRFVLNYVNN